MDNQEDVSATPNHTPISSPQPQQEEHLIKGSWTDDEDKMLVELVNTHGARRWSHIASFLKGRIGKQCRERYLNHLDPKISKKAWTREEDAIIIEMHQKYGNQWAKMSRMLEGRTANAIKNHWNSTLSRRSELKHEITDNEFPDTPTSILASLQQEQQLHQQQQFGIVEKSVDSTSCEINDVLVHPEVTSPNGIQSDASGSQDLTQYRDNKRTVDSITTEEQDEETSIHKRRKLANIEIKLETDESIGGFNPYTSSCTSSTSIRSSSKHTTDDQTPTGAVQPEEQQATTLANRRAKYEGLTLQLDDESSNSSGGVVSLVASESHSSFDLNSICNTPKMSAFADCAMSLHGGSLMSTRSLSLSARSLFFPSHPFFSSIHTPDAQTSTAHRCGGASFSGSTSRSHTGNE